MATTLGINVADSASASDHVGRAADIRSTVERAAGIRLDIGCGAGKHGETWVGIDFQALPGVDIVHDLTVFPWPLESDSVLTAVASHVVEHIPPANLGFVKFMDEVWRVMKMGGEFAIVTPHGYSPGYLQDPTHCNPCNENTWLYFAKDHPYRSFYNCKPWAIKYLAFDYTANIDLVLVKVDLP